MPFAGIEIGAADKGVQLMGANIARQHIVAGMVDEVRIHIAPDPLGDGVHLFERAGNEPIDLERTRVIESPSATHLRYRVASGQEQ